MSLSIGSFNTLLIFGVIILLILPSPAAAFGAGNIPSIAQIEGKNWRHGDIEDMLKTIAFIKGHKWTSMMIKRVYFGNWLRDYSQAVDVGSLKGVSAPTIRILVWVLSFLSFGYATKEFEVTEERLGVYRPEEHIDNPKGYADNLDARTYDKRLRGPVEQVELEIDPRTGMKNYIANESGNWATSSGYVKYSFSRSIHFGRLYTNGAGGKKGNEADLCEALRCLGQGLHCMEDFGAHTNYCELALRELGFHDVFPHTGTATMMNLHGHHVFPLVTGTFGAVDFLHSVLGEATDHFTQSEVDEMDVALKTAEEKSAGGGATRGLFGFGSSKSDGSAFISALSMVPGTGGLAQQARDLKSQSEAQEQANYRSRDGNANQVPGMGENFDPVATCKKIYPILEFRDNVVRTISNIIAKIPGLEALVEKISETLTVFVLSLLAPIIRPIIEAVSKSLKAGSSTVVDASQKQQFETWNVPTSTDPTHSMLSKDHFTNYLNPCAGRVAATILQYVAPRVIYAWQNPGVPVDEVMTDILRVFHHPAIRQENIEIQRDMFNTVRRWADEQRDRNHINFILSSASVKAGGNQKSTDPQGGHNHGAFSGSTPDQIWQKIKTRDLDEMRGLDGSETAASSGHLSPAPTSYGYQNAPHSAPEQPRPQSGGYSSHLERPEFASTPGNYQHNPGQGPLLNHGGSSPYQYGQPGWQQGPSSPPPQQYNAPPQQYAQYQPPQHGDPQYGQYGGPPPQPYGGPPPPGQYPPGQQYGGPAGYPPQGQYPMPGPGPNPPYGQPGYPPQGQNPYNNQYGGGGGYY